MNLRLIVFSIFFGSFLGSIEATPAWAAETAQLVTLDQAYELAVRNNPSLKVLRERIVQAEANRYRAYSSIKPTINWQGTFTHYNKEIAIAMGVSPIVIQKQNQFGWNLTGALPIFHGASFAKIAQAQQATEIAKLTEVRSEQDFLLGLAQSYYQVVNLQETIAALEHKLEVDRKHLTATRARFEVGQVPRSTVLRADLISTQDEQLLITARNNLFVGKRRLALLLGLNSLVDVQRPDEPKQDDTAASQLIDQALSARLDFQAAVLSRQMADKLKQAAWWNFAPSLDLTGNYRWNESTGYSGDKGSYNIMLALNVPLYDAGLRYADLREAASRIREAAAQQAAVRLSIETDIVRLSSEVDSATAGVSSAQKALKLAQITAEDMQASFAAGTASQLDVLDASQRLLDAELQYAQSLYNKDLAKLSLAHALGKFNPRGLRREKAEK